MMTITPKQLPFTENGLSSKSNQSSIKNSNETLIRSNPLSHGAMQNHDENEARSAMLTDDLFVSAHQLHSDISSNNQHSSKRADTSEIRSPPFVITTKLMIIKMTNTTIPMT